jgi:hypothetical protein
VALTHDQIGDILCVKLKSKGYQVAFSNILDVGVGEQPDCLGIDNYGDSILLEVKTSRSDFKADSKKPWREKGRGIGKQRVYVTPVGLLKPEEIPYGWQLWEMSDNKSNSLKVIKGKITRTYKDPSISCYPIKDITYPNMTADEYEYFKDTNDHRIISTMMHKIFRRMLHSGIDINSYAKGGQLFNTK